MLFSNLVHVAHVVDPFLLQNEITPIVTHILLFDFFGSPKVGLGCMFWVDYNSNVFLRGSWLATSHSVAFHFYSFIYDVNYTLILIIASICITG